MRKFLAASAVSALMVVAAGGALAQDEGGAAATQGESAGAEVTADTVVASVNGVDITLGHVILLREQLPQQYQAAPDDLLFDAIVSQLIEQTLLAEYAKAHITDIPREVELTLDNERRTLYAAVQIDAIASRDISDEAIQAAYDEKYGNLPPEPEFNASHILVETEEEAQALLEELNAGADFAELAKEKSKGPSGPDGGALGWFGLGQMVPEFEAAVVELEVGEVGGPLQTQFGWHVVKLNDKRDKPAPTLEETRASLMDELRRAAVEAEIAALREGADITEPPEGFDPSLMRDTSLLLK